MTADDVIRIYAGSDGADTMALYAFLTAAGPLGAVARDIFRAQKCSTRAKLYKKRAHKRDAYDRKTWSMGLLADTLIEHAVTLGIPWGWQYDAPREPHAWVLYVQMSPVWQVSYHTGERGKGPDFNGVWDGKSSESAMLNFVQKVVSS